MLELSPARKNKVNLSDYPSSQDIDNRIMLSDFSSFEHRLLEEILFSPLKIPHKKLVRSLECSESEMAPVLEKLVQAGLIIINTDHILVDKDMRKYFEFQIARFDPDFKPDMEFLQGLLKKVPIHILPIWYAISRSSNNIFDSIVEKYLFTPQTYIRYLGELNLGDNRLSAIIEEVFASPSLRVSSSDLIARHNLNRREFEEIMLLLEFNFVCCLTYEKEDDHWIEWATPFYEWSQYLQFLKQTQSPIVAHPEQVVRRRESDFACVEDMATLLILAQKKPIALADDKGNLSALLNLNPADAKAYLTQLIDKLCLLKFAQKRGDALHATDLAHEWLEMSEENRALYIYRHPHNQILTHQLPETLANERNIREVERAVKRVLHGKWVYFDDFLKGVLVQFDNDSQIVLKRTGKTWRYTLPGYDENQQTLIRATLFEWLFETGMVATGTLNGRECLSATPFGRFFFAS